jgi:hypothetical protein
MKAFSWRVYFVTAVVAVISLWATSQFSQNEWAEILTATPIPIALIAALYQIFRDNAAFERELIKQKFEALHIERAGVIKELYRRLIDAEAVAKGLLNYKDVNPNSIPEISQMSVKRIEEFRETEKFIKQNQIYFNEEICELLDKIIDHLLTALRKFHISHGDGVSAENRNTYLKEADEIMRKELPKVRAELKKEFRSILGV